MIVTYEPNRWSIDFDTVMTEYTRMCIEDLTTVMDFDTVMTEYSKYEEEMLELEAIVEMELEFLIAESDFLSQQGDYV